MILCLFKAEGFQLLNDRMAFPEYVLFDLHDTTIAQKHGFPVSLVSHQFSDTETNQVDRCDHQKEDRNADVPSPSQKTVPVVGRGPLPDPVYQDVDHVECPVDEREQGSDESIP